MLRFTIYTATPLPPLGAVYLQSSPQMNVSRTSSPAATAGKPETTAAAETPMTTITPPPVALGEP